VTNRIKALEQRLGVPLFERPGRRVMVTEAGRCLLPYAEKVLLLAEEARDGALGYGEKPRWALTFSALESICAYRLPPLLRPFRSRHPGRSTIPTPSKKLSFSADRALDDELSGLCWNGCTSAASDSGLR
jgi:DNA-binding transcriptional LysR family regulator